MIDSTALLASGELHIVLTTLLAPIALAAKEIAVFAYFDSQWRLLGMRHVPSDRADTVTIPVRDVVADALAFDAATVVMAHNHPSGDATPSDADYAITKRLARALDLVGVRLAEHLVLAAGGHASFRERGLL